MSSARPAGYLDAIVAWHRRRAAGDQRPLDKLYAQALTMEQPRGFAKALARGGGVSVIAEVKRRSPSKGELAPSLDPARLAVSYAAGGASCLSVLTDSEHFGGCPEDLVRARSAVSLPVLRKDFTVAERDVLDARIMGADALLLIVAALEADEVARLHSVARELSLDVVVEVHDMNELDVALQSGAKVVGVNQRNLASFEVDCELAATLCDHIPSDVVRVAESGVSSPAEVASLARAGFDAVLVGEALVTAEDPSGRVAEMVAAGRLEPARG
jgi:indole-3-glycerol phosphate synthase